ncbi:MAG: hypothetical protein ABIL01_25955 [Pseudomonadota bacterium]
MLGDEWLECLLSIPIIAGISWHIESEASFAASRKKFDETQFQALDSRMISYFFDLQFGMCRGFGAASFSSRGPRRAACAEIKNLRQGIAGGFGGNLKMVLVVSLARQGRPTIWSATRQHYIIIIV